MSMEPPRLLAKLSPRQRQLFNLAAIALLIFGVLWAVFVLTDSPKTSGKAVAPGQQRVTSVGVMAPGSQVDPREKWIGEAGKDVAQLKQDREQAKNAQSDQERFNREILGKFQSLKDDLAKNAQTPPLAAPPPVAPPAPPPAATPFPPPSALGPGGNLPAPPGGRFADSAASGLMRVTVTPNPSTKTAAAAPGGAVSGVPGNEAKARNLNNYLPVSFTRAVLLGGLDAPTGGQAQNNPQPVLLRLIDNAVLPNRFRGQVRECFVIGAGYGDIASERGYIRTENLSCIRNNGGMLEVNIQGSIFGEDGKVGVRGRLVTKQGQMLANALLAGVVGGIGTGLQAHYSSTTMSSFGAFTTTDPNHTFEAGIGAGIGKAMDRLANYYISLAEKTFPVIEIDAGRMVDVVITRGVVITEPPDANAEIAQSNFAPRNAARARKVADDDE